MNQYYIYTIINKLNNKLYIGVTSNPERRWYQHKLIAKKGKTEIARTDREDNYQETELTAQIVDVNMKQITELLYAIEQTRRIYIKKVDIAKSKKGSSLELGIVIATLLPKTE